MQRQKIIPCVYCQHSHRQTDPKRKPEYLHGAIVPGMPLPTPSTY